ncbi:MAG: MBL fold metallo-hydrolase [Balneolaceae bacterium]|nr:MBL fold metallo-hydrolase [Balneolaceae bacterium]
MNNNRINKKVYLVSDDPQELSVLSSAADIQGYHLIKDSKLRHEELVSRICAIHPDLIFLDEQSLKEDPETLLEYLKENIETSSTPIYVFTSSNGVLSEQAGKITNCKEVTTLSRGIDKSDLVNLLENALKPTVAVRFWGVRGSTPCPNKHNITYGGNTTCVQIELPFSDELLILDSGTGIRNLGNYLNTFTENVKGNIFITHPHWDHIQGFPFFKPIYHSGNRFQVHMPPQVTGGCREILSGHLTKTFFPVTLDMFDAEIEYITLESDRREYNGYSIEYLLANHPISTAIYKVRVAGRTIVFCPDNELTPIEQKTNAFFYSRLKEFFKGVDLLIHDAQYNLEEYQNKVKWGHSAWETAVDFAIRSNVKNLVLTHHDPDSSDIYLKELDEYIQDQFSDKFEIGAALPGKGLKYS